MPFNGYADQVAHLYSGMDLRRSYRSMLARKAKWQWLLAHLALLLPLALLLWDSAQNQLTANPIEEATRRTGKTALGLFVLCLTCRPTYNLVGFEPLVQLCGTPLTCPAASATMPTNARYWARGVGRASLQQPMLSRDLYKSKLISPAEAAALVRSGQTVNLGGGCAEPQTLVEALVADTKRLRGVRLLVNHLAGDFQYAAPEYAESFKVIAFHSPPNLFEALKTGRVEHLPCQISEQPRLFKSGIIRIDVAFVQLSPPDSDGFCSYGIGVDSIKPATESAGMVVAEINERMPRTLGDSFIHLSQIDYLVESSRPVLTLEPTEIGDVERAIGQIVAEMTPDGAALQAGVGGIPDAVLASLRGKSNLLIRSGVLTDGMVDLFEAGALRKSGPDGKPAIVAAMVVGTQRLYDFVHNNPSVEMQPITYTHDLNVMKNVESLVAVNSAIQVDLLGQVNAEALGGHQFSGVGGQLDFVRGAALSPGGMPIIALPSTAGRGKVSRIVDRIGQGTPVTTPRTDVKFVVTEYGVADLRGRTVRERAEALIAIAHPAFRAGLREQFERFYKPR